MEVADVFPGYSEVFPFDEFNEMQKQTLPAILNTDHNIVASAPTASGKTAVAESAICKTIDSGGTALFVAPMRALTNEKEREWERFESVGRSVYVVTGERDLNSRRARHADILVMTPEKVDSATRKHDTRRYDFINDIDLCVIDEAHLLDSEQRGSALEVIVSRLQRLCNPRFVALSATMQNIEDIADWLDAPEETTFAFSESHRPVELHSGVRTYSHGENSFADKYRRLYRALDLAEPHLTEDGQALVFVASRQDAVQAAKKARDELAERDIIIGARGDYDFHQETTALDNDQLRKSVLDGVAFHHAGLSKNDRDKIEAWFREGKIDLLFSTSTLAWGVNLPARCVVIRDTKYHDPLEGKVEMSPLDILQMLGRAGRPGYDDVGYGWIICDPSDADRFRSLLRDGKEIESHLVSNIGEHLVAEVSLGTIEDLDDITKWIKTTYWYVRSQRGEAALSTSEIRDLVRDKLSNLVEDGFVQTDEDLQITPTPLGRLTSTYYLRLDTAISFKQCATRSPTAKNLLRTVATAAEFDDVSARSDEEDAVEAVLGSRGEELSDGHRKVLAILRAAMSGTLPSELRSDAWVIKQNALRLIAALGAFCEEFSTPKVANRVRQIEARIEYGVGDDAVGLTEIDGVGTSRANKLAAAGYTTPEEVASATPTQLSNAGLPDSAAERIYNAANKLPQITVDWGSFPDTVTSDGRDIYELTIRNGGNGANASIRLTVNEAEMTAKETYLQDITTIPAAVFGSDTNELEFTLEITFPSLAISPVTETRTVIVR